MTVTWNDQILPEIQAAAVRGVAGWATIVQDHAVKLIKTGPKTGRIYRIRGAEHQASAPTGGPEPFGGGEAPADQSGRLANSSRIELFPEEVRARLTFSTEYAAMLELGTKNMEPRPFLRRALAETSEEGLAFFNNELRAVFS